MRVERIRIGDARLDGDVAIPRHACGCVIFAHGSGSSRHSPRNLHVAGILHTARLATVLFDLLTPDEARRDAVDASWRFDIPMLGARLTAAVDDIAGRASLGSLPLGVFGASTGAAAALVCAAGRPELVHAVVSRGGRPDLAGDALARVRAPTLLLVGELDAAVLTLTEKASRMMVCPHEVGVVPGATHLFEEPGALDEVAQRAGAWFIRSLDH